MHDINWWMAVPGIAILAILIVGIEIWVWTHALNGAHNHGLTRSERDSWQLVLFGWTTLHILGIATLAVYLTLEGLGIGA